MKISLIDKIKQAADQGREIPTACIEYSCELPEHEEISETEFFGVPAKYNPNVNGDVNLTYRM